jgi:hypothetical protein
MQCQFSLVSIKQLKDAGTARLGTSRDVDDNNSRKYTQGMLEGHQNKTKRESVCYGLDHQIISYLLL